MAKRKRDIIPFIMVILVAISVISLIQSYNSVQPEINEPSVIIGYQKVPDPNFDVVTTLSKKVGNDLVVEFYHTSQNMQKIWVNGNVSYTLSRDSASKNDVVKLTVFNWDNQYFELHVGDQSVILKFGRKRILIDKAFSTSAAELVLKDEPGGLKLGSDSGGITMNVIAEYDGQVYDIERLKAVAKIKEKNYITKAGGYKFALNFSSITDDIIARLGWVGVDIDYGSMKHYDITRDEWVCDDIPSFDEETAAVTTSQSCHREYDYSIVLGNGVIISFNDLVASGFTVKKAGDTRWIFGNLTNGYKNGILYIDPTAQASCGTLNTENETYQLTGNVDANGTCFTVTANGITLDCLGYRINYTQGSTAGYGVYGVGMNFTTIQNCFITQGNDTIQSSHGIYFINNVTNLTVFNNTVRIIHKNSSGTSNSSYGIVVANDVKNISVYNNTVTTLSNYSYGIYLVTRASNNSVYRNVVTTNGSWAYGIALVTITDRTTAYLNTVRTGGYFALGIYPVTNFTNGSIYSNNITTIGATGIALYMNSRISNNSVYFNNITTNGSYGVGIQIQNNCTSNNIFQNKIITSYSGTHGIVVTTATAYNNIYFNDMTTNNSNTAYGILLTANAHHNTFWNNTMRSNSTRIAIQNSTYNTFENETLIEGTTTSNYDIRVWDNSTGNNFTGGVLNRTDISIADGLNNLTIKWWLTVNVTSRGYPVSGVTVNVTDVSNMDELYSPTDSSGFAVAAAKDVLMLSNFSSTAASCSGTHSACSTWTYNQPVCESHACSYDIYIDICYGTPHACSSHTAEGESACTSAGCTWTAASSQYLSYNASYNNHTVKINGTGFLTNITTRNMSANVQLNIGLNDTAAPSISIALPQNATYNYNTSLPLNYTATDNTAISQCKYSLDDATNVTLTGCSNVTFNASSGWHKLFIYANDTTNIRANASVNFTITLLSAIPSISISLPTNTTYNYNTSLLLTYTASDDVAMDQCKYSLDDATNVTFTNCDTNATFNASIGWHKLFVYVNDSSSNNASASVNFTSSGSGVGVSSCEGLNVTNTYYVLTGDVGSDGTCFTIRANNVTLDCSGYMINYTQGSTVGYGVTLVGKNFTTIENCFITQGNDTISSSHGIYFINNVTNISIFNNTLRIIHQNSSGTGNSSHGIVVANDVTNISIYNNTITTVGNYSYGIYLLTRISNSSVYRNVITTNGTRGYGITFTINTYGIDTYMNTVRTGGSSAYAIYPVVNVTNSSIYSNNITTIGASGLGVFFNNRISNNSVYYNNMTTNGSYGVGIQLSINSTSNSIFQNKIFASYSATPGMVFSDSSYNSVYQNNITTNSSSTSYGIYLTVNTHHNTFWNNTMRSNSTRIAIQNSTYNTFENETLIEGTTTSNFDIYVYDNSTDNNFTGVSFDKTDIGWGAGDSNFTVKWFLTVNATNETGKPVPATLGITENVTGATIFSGAVASNGLKVLAVREFTFYTGFGNTCFGTHSACSTWNSDETGCSAHGCTWIGPVICGGTPHACSSHTAEGESACTSAGCTWSAQGIGNNVTYNNHTVKATATGYVSSSASVNVTSNNFFGINISTNTILTSCGSLTIANAVHILQNDVNATGTCFTISANNVTLDCQGRLINYSQSSAGYGVYASTKHNATIKNCNITTTSATATTYGIYLLNSDSANITNNTIYTKNSYGIYIITTSAGTNYHSVTRNRIKDATHGIYLDGVGYSNFTTNNITARQYALYLTGQFLYTTTSSYNNISYNAIYNTYSPTGISMDAFTNNNLGCGNIEGNVSDAGTSNMVSTAPCGGGSVNYCTPLISAGTYTLQSDVNSSGTCFRIDSNSVVLDGNSKLIRYAKGSAGYAVRISPGYNSSTISN
ncbi:MAG: right-handed parallel beta-helix repeat-containing protein, partial [Candidatus Aenigmarchaeota archaeon]|nr:right-handed parallel beta-helix repeat-containing protein [Candidatus Aenigmarchaeota archaeon]